MIELHAFSIFVLTMIGTATVFYFICSALVDAAQRYYDRHQ